MRLCKFLVAIAISLSLLSTGALAMENSKSSQQTAINMNDVIAIARLGMVLKENIDRVKFVKCKSIVVSEGELKSYEEGNFCATENDLIAWCARYLWDTMKLIINPDSLSSYLKNGVIVFYCTDRSKDDGVDYASLKDKFD